jgi:hypothetical protein
MISKLRRLNTLLAELGEKNLTLTFNQELPKTRSIIASSVKLGSNIDASYEPRNPLVLEFVTYEKVWGQPEKVTAETEFATITVKNHVAPPEERKQNPRGGTIEVTEEFGDYALKLLEEKVRAKFKEEIITELVEARLKERGLV